VVHGRETSGIPKTRPPSVMARFEVLRGNLGWVGYKHTLSVDMFAAERPNEKDNGETD